MDSQWPRYEVFEQERPDQPHRNAGSVHAPDAEMALQNARDVFARRPETVSLWVAPASRIYSRTAEQLAAGTAEADEQADGAERPETFLVFNKQSQRQAETFVTHVGQVEARAPSQALQSALDRFGSSGVYVWWVIPARSITRSTDHDIDSMFAPARGKPHRMPNFYPVHRQMREAAAAGAPAPPGEASP
jgi:ring-1,2-phenylacetyl-CoA epoxidase subunit PaaB